MINYDLNYFKNKVIEAKKNNRPVIFKKFIDDENIPNWELILKVIYKECQEDPGKELKSIIAKNPKETLVGNTIVSENLFVCIARENKDRNRQYFPDIFKIMQTIKEYTSINIELIGPKVSIGPAQNLSHTDNWDAFSLQCEGSTTWILSDKSYLYKLQDPPNYLEEFNLNRGDFVFFPKGMWHQINTELPRANLQFNSNIML